MSPRFIRLAKTNASLLALAILGGCASLRSTPSDRLDHHVAQADAAYRRLDADQLSAYNHALASIARDIDGETPNELHTELDAAGVKLDDADIKLPLARYHVTPSFREPNESSAVGVPMLLDYDTTNAPLYPREGLLVSATAVYHRVHNERHLSFVAGKNSIKLNGSTYPLKIDNVAPIAAMTQRGRHVARAGFSSMLDSAKMPVKTGIFLTEPYRPKQNTDFDGARITIDAIRIR